jgi:uncharacterized phiE125 gp8 family phage protein
MTVDSNPTGIKSTSTEFKGIDYQQEWTLTRLTEPNLEPITTAEAKEHLREQLVDSDNDTYIDGLVATARGWVEDDTGVALVDQVWQLQYQGYSYGEFKLRRYPVIEVQSFVYDEGGVATTLAASNYELVGRLTKWPKIIPAYGQTWPANNWVRPMTIQFRAGYADRSASPSEGAEKIPKPFKHAIKLIVGHWYENRESVGIIPPDLAVGIRNILKSYRSELGIA